MDNPKPILIPTPTQTEQPLLLDFDIDNFPEKTGLVELDSNLKKEGLINPVLIGFSEIEIKISKPIEFNKGLVIKNKRSL